MTDSLRNQLQSSLGTAYTLERELGGGGMSRVFVAEETRLGRKVVVKLLSVELAAGVSAERFEREIRLAAALQQANIVPLLSAGDTNGLPYYTMPLVDGLSLRARLERNGAMPVPEVVSVLRDVSRALAYAHERGVVHRDIKPENILLSGDAAVVTDFGIAKALSASKTDAPGGTLTQVGTSIGTPAYMAPEQASGDPNTDHRADLYALGCVAYEMLTGAAPFAGRPVHQLFAAHLTETPPAVGVVRTDTPTVLADLVMRCLEKDPGRRPSSAREVLQALDGVTTGASGAECGGSETTHDHGGGPRRRRGARHRRCAARPARCVRHDGECVAQRGGGPAVRECERRHGVQLLRRWHDRRAGDGAGASARSARDVACELLCFPHPRRARRHRDRSPAPRGCDHRRHGAPLRRPAPHHGAAHACERRPEPVGGWIHHGHGRRVRRAVAAHPGDRVGGGARAGGTHAPRRNRQVSDPGTKDPAAYDSYLRARFEFNRRGFGVRRSMTLFQEALQRDPNFAEAWGGLASAWAVLPWYEASASAAGVLDSVRFAAERAIALDSLKGEPYVALGYAMTEVGEIDKAIPLMERGAALDQRSAIARMWLSTAYRKSQQVDKEESALREAMALDPMSGIVISSLAGTVARDPARAEEARALARRAVAVDPENYGTIGNSQDVLMAARSFDEAIALFHRARRISSNPQPVGTIVIAFAAKGQRDSAMQVLAELQRLPKAPKTDEVIAVGAAALEMWDLAFSAAGSAARAERTMLFIPDFAYVWQPKARDPRMRALCAFEATSCEQVLKEIEQAKPLR